MRSPRPQQDATGKEEGDRDGGIGIECNPGSFGPMNDRIRERDGFRDKGSLNEEFWKSRLGACDFLAWESGVSDDIYSIVMSMMKFA